MRERTFTLNKKTAGTIRKQWGYQTQLAKAMSIDVGRLNNWLAGRADIPESQVKELSLHSNIPLSELLSAESLKILVS